MRAQTISRSKQKLLDSFIKRVAYQADKLYPSRYQDVEDYIQIGYIALWKATEKWDASKNGGKFESFAMLLIARDIRKEAIRSTCVASASYKTKVLAAKIRSDLSKGIREDKIASQLGVNRHQWELMRGLFSFCPDQRILEKIEDGDESAYCVLGDILSIKSLTDEEREIIIARFNNQDLDIPRTSLWRKMKMIRDKLAKSGYECET